MSSRPIGRLLAAAALLLALLPSPASAAGLPGLSPRASALFATDARSGTLVREGRPGSRRYALTLRGVNPRVTWFADRPGREAGRIPTRSFFARWGDLGFRAVPPNGALIVEGAPTSRDAVALELRLRSYSPRTRTARFRATRLDRVGRGLAHLHRRLDAGVPRRFGRAALFVDNATQDGCILGQADLFPFTRTVQNYAPADGRLMSVQMNPALFNLYGTTYGGDGRVTFALPNLPAPQDPGYDEVVMSWQICTTGLYPDSPAVLAYECQTGTLFPVTMGAMAPAAARGMVPADGRQLARSAYPGLSSAAPGSGPIQVPAIPPPGPNAFWALCVSDFQSSPGVYGQVNPVLAGARVPSRIPLDANQTLAAGDWPVLYQLLTTFSSPYAELGQIYLPFLPSLPGTTWQMATFGVLPWPSSSR